MSDQTKIERILRFISIISGRRDLTVDDLAREMDTTRRTVYRYLGALDNCGFTIEKKDRCFSLRGMPVGGGDRLVMLIDSECGVLGGCTRESGLCIRPVMETLSGPLSEEPVFSEKAGAAS